MAMRLSEHIETSPDVAGGKPRISGHRITVQDIVIWHERLGQPVDEITDEYDLSLSAVYAALAYYHDHRQEIDHSIRDDQDFVERFRQDQESKLADR